MKTKLISAWLFGAWSMAVVCAEPQALRTSETSTVSVASGTSAKPGMLPSRVLAKPVEWFRVTTPTELSKNVSAQAEVALGLPARAAQIITKKDGTYSSFAWTALNLPLPPNRLLHVPVYLDDFQANGGYSLALEIQLTNAGGAIRYIFSVNAFKPAGWSYLPLWDPATPANAVFSKQGTSWVVANSGFDFSRPVTGIRIVPNNLPAGARIGVGSIETATKTKPLIVVTDDITDNSTYTHIVPIMEAAGFRGGLRIGGAKEQAFGDRMIKPLRVAYDNGWDVYNGSWSRTGFVGPLATDAASFAHEIVECETRAKALGFTRGMTWFSGAGNGLPVRSVCEAVAPKTGLRVLKSGGGLGYVNIVRAGGVDPLAIVTSTGMGGTGEQPATGVRGENTITRTNPRALREGAVVSGTGIGIGAKIAANGVRGDVVTLTVPNIADVAGLVAISDSFEAHEALTDGLLYTGGAIIYFMHDLKPEEAKPSSISFPVEDFEKLVAYWKSKSGQGLLEVVTPSQFDEIMRGER